MPLTENNIAEMRLRHLDLINQRIAALQDRKHYLRLGTLAFIALGGMLALIAHSILVLAPVVIISMASVVWDLELARELEQLRQAHHESLAEGFEAVPDFGVLGKIRTPFDQDPAENWGSYIIYLILSGIVTLFLGFASQLTR